MELPGEEPGAILDYASPRPRTKARLASRSVLTLFPHADGCLVTETLSGRAGAIGALIFTVSVLVVMGVIAQQFARHHQSEAVAVVAFLALLALGLISLSLLVIRNTWRTTVLEIADSQLVITFGAPFTSRVRFAWPVSEILSLQLIKNDDPAAIGELRIFPQASPEVRLYTDHPLADLYPVAAAIQTALGGSIPSVAIPTVR